MQNSLNDKQLWLVIFFLSLVFSYGYAQNVRGTVKERSLGNTIRPIDPKGLIESVTINGKGLSALQELEFKNKEFSGPVKTKEISLEISVGKMAEMLIENQSRHLIIKTWKEPKVKISTQLFYDANTLPQLSDTLWFEKLNIQLKMLGNMVRLKSGAINNNFSFDFPVNGLFFNNGNKQGNVAVFNAEGEHVGSKPGERNLILYIPETMQVEVECKYADVRVENDLNKLRAEITNGNLEMGNAKSVRIVGKYANINLGNCAIAEIELSNGKLLGLQCDELDLDSKYSTVEFATVGKLKLRSSNDEYEFDAVGEVTGRKTYGNLRINSLSDGLELVGSNADVKIRKLTSTVKYIKLEGRYADIRLPLRDNPDYVVNFSGNYSSVFGNFERKPFAPARSDTAFFRQMDHSFGINRLQGITSRYRDCDDCEKEGKFSATLGTGKALRLNIKCDNCTVDFK